MLDLILNSIDLQRVQEIRIRVGQPIKFFDGKWKYLSNEKYCKTVKNVYEMPDNCIVPMQQDVEEIVFNACEKSVYAFNRQIISGYLTISGGIRLGICGKVVYGDKGAQAVKEYSSIIMRIPHQIIGCSDCIIKELTTPLCNTLVVSPPSAGKTTLIRDIARQLGRLNYNCLIADEREEIASFKDGISPFELPNCDCFSGCDKQFCFTVGLRSCSPQVIICDEIQQNEIQYVERATASGVKVIGSMHGETLLDVKKRAVNHVFDKIVILSNKKQVGEIVGVYDSNQI